jgi:hypothetical protein
VSGDSTRTRSTLGSSRSLFISSSPMIVPALSTVPSPARDVVGEAAREQPRFEVEALAGLVGLDVVEPHAANRTASFEGIVVVDDELLRDVDETAGEVAGVGSTQRRIDETLTGAWRGDEELEHCEAFAVARLDGSRNHVAARVGDQPAHAGDLAHLQHVAASTRTDHHVERVELHRLERDLHRVLDLGGRLGPDLDLFLTTLPIGDDTATELLLDLVGFFS